MSSLTSLCPAGFISTRVVSNACNCGVEHFSDFVCRKSLEQCLGQVRWPSAVILPELENSPTNPEHQFGFVFQSEDLPSGLPKAFTGGGPGSIAGQGTRSHTRHLGLYHHLCGPQFLLLNRCPPLGALNLRWGKKELHSNSQVWPQGGSRCVLVYTILAVWSLPSCVCGNSHPRPECSG